MSKARDIASAAPAPAGVTSTELGYVDGVTSAIQTQINTKSAIADEFSAGKNKIINGGFDIWQRGTSVAFGTVGGYGADRWIIVRTGWAGGATMSRQTGPETIQYAARIQRDSGNTNTAYIGTTTSVETANSVPFQNKTVTFSFYARAGANFSATSSLITAKLFTGTGTDQNLTTAGYTGSATPISQTPTLTTSWQRFQYTATLASNANEMGLEFSFNPTGTAGANDWFEITGVQLELGSIATPFARTGGTIQGELAACQRYYFRQTLAAGATSGSAFGSAKSTTVATMVYSLPVTMRVAPTSGEHSNIRLWDGANVYTVTSSVFSGSTDGFGTADFGVASGLTQYRPYQIIANASLAGYVAFSAEL